MVLGEENQLKTGHPFLELKDITHIFPGGIVGIQDITLSLKWREPVVVAGLNGAGKSVLARHLAGLLDPTNGKVYLRGKSTDRNTQKPYPGIGMVFQNSENQFVGQTVSEDVSFGPGNKGLNAQEIKEKTNRALEEMSISHLEKRNPHFLSGGEKRRLAIAGVLALDPEMIIMDEPFTGLDYPGVIELLKAIEDLKKGGKTIVVLTHHVEKISAHAERIVILHQGKVAADGPPDAIVPKFRNHNLSPYAETVWREMSWLPNFKV